MRNEFKIGLTVVLAVIVAYMGFRFMSDLPIFRQTQEIVATYDRVDGLGTGNMVYLNGVKVGSVKNIELSADKRVRVVMSIERDIEIPVDSRAKLTSIGIIDGKAIVIELGESEELVIFGGEIEGEYVESMMEAIGERGDQLGDDLSASLRELNQFLKQLNATLDDESRRSIGQVLENMETSTAAVSDLIVSRQQELEEAISSANRALAQLDTLLTGNRPRIDILITNMDESVAEFRDVSRDLDQTVNQLNDVLGKINEGEGSIGKLLNDPSFYDNADSLSVELRNLIQQINENPGRYLRHMKLIEIF